MSALTHVIQILTPASDARVHCCEPVLSSSKLHARSHNLISNSTTGADAVRSLGAKLSAVVRSELPGASRGTGDEAEIGDGVSEKSRGGGGGGGGGKAAAIVVAYGR